MIYRYRNCSIDLTSAEPTLMAIVNVTPDSFHDGGALYNDPGKAVMYAHRMIEQGAKIIDIGGESTRPGAVPVSAEDEMERVMPVVERLVTELGDSAVLSVDTTKPSVAAAALDAGVQIINDVGGLTDDMLDVLVKHKCPCYVLTDTGYDTSGRSDTDIEYSLLPDMSNRFMKQIARLNDAGISQIIADPGFGFHKTLADNYYILNNLDFFMRLNLPVLAGISHKSMIYKILPDNADTSAATLVLDAVAVQKGASILRIHDVEIHSHILAVLDALHRYS